MWNWLARLATRQESRPSNVALSAQAPRTDKAWLQVPGETGLAQGDYLTGCFVPQFAADFGARDAEQVVGIEVADLIVVTQSCDLENQKVHFVALCPIYKLAVFERQNPKFAKKGEWENVRQGRLKGLHMLASPTSPELNREALVVDFRQIVSLPIGYVASHAATLAPRWRLQSPILEHYWQAFARFFMRVGLPSAIPKFR